MQQELARVIEQVSKEKGIDRAIVVAGGGKRHAVGCQESHRRRHAHRGAVQPEIGEVELFKILTVVERLPTREIEISLDRRRGANSIPRRRWATSCWRSCAQPTVASPRRRRSRTSSRGSATPSASIIYNEFKDRKGELIHSGIVQRFEKKNIIVNLGRTDAILPEKEQIPRERYRQGDRIRAYILDVDMSGEGPADRPLAHPSRLPDQAVRAGSAGDLRGDRRGARRRRASRAAAPRSRSSRTTATSIRSARASA